MRIALLPVKVVKAPAFQQVTREGGEVIVLNVVEVYIPNNQTDTQLMPVL